MSPILDLFITLLSMGSVTWKEILRQRKESFSYLREELSDLAHRHETRLLDVKRNDISLAMSLDPFDSLDSKKISFLGSMLFSRFVSGTRVVPKGTKSTPVSGMPTMEGWMSHSHDFPVAYMTAAGAVGLTKDEVDEFISRLDKVLVDFKKTGKVGS